MYGNQGLSKAYKAAAQIGPNLIVKFTANPGEVTPAAAASDKVIGVTVPNITVPTGQRVDVVHVGITELVLGGTVAAGDMLTSDANGKGVTAAPAAGANNFLVGRALFAGVAGDIIPVLLTLGSFQG